MSKFSLNAEHSQPQSPPPSPSFPEPSHFAALAEKLQGTAQALLSFCRAMPQEQSPVQDGAGNNGAFAAAGSAADLEDGPACDEGDNPGASGETRCYHFSPLVLRQENELLDAQNVDDFHGLFYNAYTSLAGLTALMENIRAEAEIDGSIVHILARELKRTEDLLFQIHDAYSTVCLVEQPATA